MADHWFECKRCGAEFKADTAGGQWPVWVRCPYCGHDDREDDAECL